MNSLGGSTGPTGGNMLPKGYKYGQLQNFTPEQMNLFQNLFSQVGPNSQLAQLAGGDQSQFEQLEAPALRQFQGLQGQLASRFSGMGSGARRSSGFQNAATSASQDFAERLQSQRMGLQRQALQDLMGLSDQLLSQRPYEQSLQTHPFLVKPDKKKQLWESLLGGGLPIAGVAIGGAFGGPAGAMIGGQIGSSAAQAFL
jgi:hypothetical protein